VQWHAEFLIKLHMPPFITISNMNAMYLFLVGIF
jgi:hypothetical protein